MGEGVPLLMLHSFFAEASGFLPLMERLSTRFRCIGLDMLGFGESSKPEIRYSVTAEVRFVTEFIDRLDLPPCYILGHSFGGWVGTAYTLKCPDRITGLILVAPAGIRDDSLRDRNTPLQFLLNPTPLVDWGLTLATPIAGVLGQREELAKIKWFRQQLMRQPAGRSFITQRLTGIKGAETVDPQIHQIAQPTLVIAGELDETIPLWHSQTYADKIPNAQLVVIPDADHALPQKYAPQMAEEIDLFFAS
ncbi:alpha/beta hydrolase [Oscillatoriales cyanobacterium LEGE 11467]|uniref:Alpha/beta hydrolase n=2 Tax=Zarconia TaxID=2992130 RepID=A0A928VXT9_9CYAN|nr:alpha/beta hydrolase [Zarconia navalis LEGE 11467]